MLHFQRTNLVTDVTCVTRIDLLTQRESVQVVAEPRHGHKTVISGTRGKKQENSDCRSQ